MADAWLEARIVWPRGFVWGRGRFPAPRVFDLAARGVSEPTLA